MSYPEIIPIAPPAIGRGDKIAIISPATEVKAHWVRGATAELKVRGYQPIVMPHALGPCDGSFAASEAGRLDDLREAIANPEIRAILCARGGYGCIHLLSPQLQRLVSENPKWLIGFSDISALHALWQKAGIRSLHCSMAKQLTLFDLDSQEKDIIEYSEPERPSDTDRELLRECVGNMFDILEEKKEKIIYEQTDNLHKLYPHLYCGEAEGEIAGGNLAVLNGLASTPWDIMSKEFLAGKILFLEDIGEKIYQVERMLTRLHLAGAFDQVIGLVFGQFTDYKPDKNFTSMEEMIATRLKEWGVRCPVTLNFPVGHTAVNRPIPEGGAVRLKVTPEKTVLELIRSRK